MTDSIFQLIEGCKRQERASQLALYDRYSVAMFTIASRYFDNDEDAKDAMQEGFIKFFKHIKNYNGQTTIGVWLKRIVINACIDMAKSKYLRMHFEPIDETQLTFANEIDEAEDVISTTLLIQAICCLKEEQGVVVKLYLIEGYDHKEIAQILGIPEATSRTYLRRGRLHLQKILKKEL